MTRERWSALLRWAGLAAAGGVLVSVLSARGPSAAAGRGPLAPGGGPASLVAGVISDLAAADITGPFTSTVPVAGVAGDLSQQPYQRPAVRPASAEPGEGHTEALTRTGVTDPVAQTTRSSLPGQPSMPAPLQSFAGLDFENYGSGWPPDTNGDVGPVYYLQTVNTSVGIFNKSTGALAAAFSYAQLWASAGATTACGSNGGSDNRGDPVALYDAQADRYIVADFAFTSEGSGPYYECLAVSRSGDPVAGGWYLYALRTDDNAAPYFADYPKLGVWPDGIYLSANRYDCHGTANCNPATNAGVRVWALNKTDLYGGQALHTQHFDLGTSYFGLLPSNLKGAAPPAGAPNYFVANPSNGSTLEVWKLHVDWANWSNSTFTGPAAVSIAGYIQPPGQIPEVSGVAVDSLGDRLMMQNQYRNIGGIESLWLTHTAGSSPTNITGARWYQLSVTGGTIGTTPVQQGTYRPDSTHRWMPSLAVDRLGDMAVGYSVSSASQHPDIRYAGRLFGDPANTLGQGETTLVAGTGGEMNCGCARWGDYSAMTVDPIDDCTFWYTTEYFASDSNDWQTRIGSFRYPGCGVVYSHFTFLPSVAHSSGGWVNLLQEGFEGAWPSAGWTLEDNLSGAYTWGQRACQASSGTFGAWAIGGGPAGTGLACGANYPDNAQVWMIHAPVSLAGATAAELDLQVLANTASGDDYVAWLASLDGSQFYGLSTSGNTGGFGARTLDLSSVPVPANVNGNFLGQPQVFVAVLFHSDGSGNAPTGAMVDDLLVRVCLNPVCGSLARPAASGSGHALAVKLTRPAH